MTIYNLLLLAIPFLYRLTGSDANVPLKRIYRNVLVPLIVWLNFQTLPVTVSMVFFGIGLSLNLDEIEKRDWWAVYAKAMMLSGVLAVATGNIALLFGIAWLGLIYCSNNDIKFPKFLNRLDWKYVEYAIGASITVSCYMALLK